MSRRNITLAKALGLFVFAILCGVMPLAHAATPLDDLFQQPPDSARPWVYWFWLNGNITREGITADLEAMKRAGIGGVLIMEVDQGAPVGPVDFMGTSWRELFKHVVAEAERLGLQVNMNDDAGWNGSGGPWIKPEEAMQKVVWSETKLDGPQQFEGPLPQPETIAGYYRDIAVLAFPTPGPYIIDDIHVKACYQVGSPGPPGTAQLPPDVIIKRDGVLNLSEKMGQAGGLKWEVPAGSWTVLRFGHTCTGVENAPAPATGRGLECDKLSKAGIEANFKGMMEKLITDVGPAAGKTLVATHIDSWENGAQNWTDAMREEFKRRRGYDLLAYLPAMTGRVVGSLEISERFLWDLRQTISEMVVENYAGHMRTLANKHGLKLSIEAYGGPTDDIPYAGQADEPMCEFWIGGGAMQTCKEMASAVHVYGKPILGAEAFTAGDRERWLEHPASIKALGDQAFCDGVNRFVFHRYAMQPWLDRRPGMTMGPWGLHYERTNTWWDYSLPWHTYLARCQALLRRGLFVADLCYLQPENAPQGLAGHERTAYDYDHCNAEVVLTRMTVKDGRIVLPDGMSYRLLVLPSVPTMTPRLLGKIVELVEAGAAIVGPRPLRSPSLADYPRCDEQVRELADKLWGPDKPIAELTERAVGQGRVFACPRVERDGPPSKGPLEQAKWIWHKEGNPAAAAPVGQRYFRRLVAVPADRAIASARLALTADNSFEARLNGRSVKSGEDFTQVFAANVTPLLKPGVNILAVEATNGADQPNPAGLIASLAVQFQDGGEMRWDTDRQWQSRTTASEKWASDAAEGGWAEAMELGPWGMPPWGQVGRPQAPAFPDADVIVEALGKLGVRPDFEGRDGLRYIHRRDGDTDIYFIANGKDEWAAANCIFRVAGKRPEIWDPLTGGIMLPAIYQEADGRITLPLWLEPGGSQFVVFRKPSVAPEAVVAFTHDGRSALPQPDRPHFDSPVAELYVARNKDLVLLAREWGQFDIRTAGGKTITATVGPIPEAVEIAGPWEVRFAPGGGAPDRGTLDKLISWSEHQDAGVKHFSGMATYQKTLQVPETWFARDRRLSIDLGDVRVMAAVKLNGQDVGILWKPPYRADVTSLLKPGENTLEISVVNLWPNRLIGDEALPEDSDRHPSGTLKSWPQWLLDGKASPTGRLTFTTWRLWRKGDSLQESGLLGPVTLRAQTALGLKP